MGKLWPSSIFYFMKLTFDFSSPNLSTTADTVYFNGLFLLSRETKCQGFPFPKWLFKVFSSNGSHSARQGPFQYPVNQSLSSILFWSLEVPLHAVERPILLAANWAYRPLSAWRPWYRTGSMCWFVLGRCFTEADLN